MMQWQSEVSKPKTNKYTKRFVQSDMKVLVLCKIIRLTKLLNTSRYSSADQQFQTLQVIQTSTVLGYTVPEYNLTFGLT